MLERKFVECRKLLVEKMDGMEVNLEGVRFTVSVSVPIEDDFERMKKEWEEFYAFEAGKTRGLFLIRVELSYVTNAMRCMCSNFCSVISCHLRIVLYEVM